MCSRTQSDSTCFAPAELRSVRPPARPEPVRQRLKAGRVDLVAVVHDHLVGKVHQRLFRQFGALHESRVAVHGRERAALRRERVPAGLAGRPERRLQLSQGGAASPFGGHGERHRQAGWGYKRVAVRCVGEHGQAERVADTTSASAFAWVGSTSRIVTSAALS